MFACFGVMFFEISEKSCRKVKVVTMPQIIWVPGDDHSMFELTVPREAWLFRRSGILFQRTNKKFKNVSQSSVPEMKFCDLFTATIFFILVISSRSGLDVFRR